MLVAPWSFVRCATALAALAMRYSIAASLAEHRRNRPTRAPANAPPVTVLRHFAARNTRSMNGPIRPFFSSGWLVVAHETSIHNTLRY
jgi:hypothetical protein